MRKTRATTGDSSQKAAASLGETVTAAQKALREAVDFELLVPSEIIGIKASLKDLETGALHLIPYQGNEEFEKLWFIYLDRVLSKKGADFGVIACILDSDTSETNSEEIRTAEYVNENETPLVIN